MNKRVEVSLKNVKMRDESFVKTEERKKNQIGRKWKAKRRRLKKKRSKQEHTFILKWKTLHCTRGG